MESHPWNFAIKTKKLAQLSATPVVRFDFFYALPSDFVRVVAVFDNDAGTGIVDHEIKDNKVACSASEVWLKYVYDVTDPNDMSPNFMECLSAAIAIEGAIDLAQSSSLREVMEKSFEKAFRRARSIDGSSNFPERLPQGSWATSRHGRVGGRGMPW